MAGASAGAGAGAGAAASAGASVASGVSAGASPVAGADVRSGRDAGRLAAVGSGAGVAATAATAAAAVSAASSGWASIPPVAIASPEAAASAVPGTSVRSRTMATTVSGAGDPATIPSAAAASEDTWIRGPGISRSRLNSAPVVSLPVSVLRTTTRSGLVASGCATQIPPSEGRPSHRP